MMAEERKSKHDKLQKAIKYDPKAPALETVQNMQADHVYLHLIIREDSIFNSAMYQSLK